MPTLIFMGAVCFCIFHWVTQLPNEFINKKLKSFQDDRLHGEVAQGYESEWALFVFDLIYNAGKKIIQMVWDKGDGRRGMEHGDDEKRLEIWEFQLFTHFYFLVLSMTNSFLHFMISNAPGITYLFLLEIKICQSTICK